MEDLIIELKLIMNALNTKIEEAVFVIDVKDIPDGVTPEEFAEQWKEHQDKGELIYISR